MFKSIFRVISIVVMLSGTQVQAQEVDVEHPTYLYKATLMRAAPGHLLDLIKVLKDMKELGYYDVLEEETPFIMRHSQGDQWDLMVIQPLGSYRDYYAAELIDHRHSYRDSVTKWRQAINAHVVFKSDLYAYGPDLSLVGPAFADNDFYHVEMFSALAGMHDALVHERVMENDYLVATGRRANMIFVSDAGNDFDNFTIGFHKSLKAFAAGNTATEAETEAAIVSSGFPAGTDIGAYLRRFLASHHDTLATAVR